MLRKLSLLFLTGALPAAVTAQTAGWVPQAAPSSADVNLTSVRFFDPGKGLVLGSDGVLYATADGGSRWDTVPPADPQNPLVRSFSFIDPNTGWITNRPGTGTTGSIYRTTNGGGTWQSMTNVVTGEPRVQFLDADTGWVIGLNVDVYRSVDGGETWANKNAGGWHMEGLHFLNGNTGWITLRDGGVLKNVTASSTWTVSLTLDDSVYNVFFVDSDFGWAVGANGKVYRSTDGGDSWTPQTSGVSTNLRAVHFTDRNTGWIVGDGGITLRTGDGGATWVPVSSGTTADLTSLFFVNERTGWTVGDSGTVLRTAGADPVRIRTPAFRPQHLEAAGGRLRYRLDAPAHVTVTLRGVEGARKTVLFSGRQAAGEHRLDATATGLPSGIYLLDFESGSERTVRTVFLP